MNENITSKFNNAINSFIDKIKEDKNVIALIVMGSFSYDIVWEKSDIDALLIVRDQVLNEIHFCVNEEDIPINITIVQRSELKRYYEKSFGGSIHHSFITTSKIVYSTDETLYEYLENIKIFGKDDMNISLMIYATELIANLEKCMKWLYVKKNNLYCQYWILKAAEKAAEMIICLNMETPNREAILRACEINNPFMEKYYVKPLSNQLSYNELECLINELNNFLQEHINTFSIPILDFLADGEIKTLSVISKHFKIESHFLFHLLDYLSEYNLIEKISQTIAITPKSRKVVEEMAFVRIID